MNEENNHNPLNDNPEMKSEDPIETKNETKKEDVEISIEDLIPEDTDVDELLDKYDKDSSKLRKLTGPIALAVSVVAIFMSLFHLYTAYFGTLLSMKQRSLHILLAFVLGLALYPATKRSKKERPTIIDVDVYKRQEEK